MIKRKYKLVENKFDNKSPRYQTKRWQERVERQYKVQADIIKLEEALQEEHIDEEERRIILLKLNTLKKQNKVVKKGKKLEEHLIPFFVKASATSKKPYVVYIREHNLFKQKWVDLLGLKTIKKRYDDFLYLLEIGANPTYTVGDCWNPF